MTIQIRILAAMIAAAGFQAYAEDAPPEGPRGPRPPPGEFFAKKDADKDGKLTLAEFKTGMPEEMVAKADEIFKKIDANGDGGITPEEMKEHRPPRGGPGGEGRGPGGDRGKRRGPPPEGEGPGGGEPKGI